MPKPKKYNKTYKKKRNYRKKYRKPLVKPQKNYFGFPDIMYTKLKYVQSNVQYVSGTDACKFWRLNSIYDPDYSGVGGQPRFHDQFALIYNKYIVNGCKVKYTIYNDSTTEAAKFAIAPATYLNFSSVDWLAEKNHSIWGIVSPIGSNNKKIVKRYYNVKRLIGRDRQEQDISALVGANPSIPLFIYVGLRNYTDTSTAISVSVQLEMTFYIKFYEKVFVGTS